MDLRACCPRRRALLLAGLMAPLLALGSPTVELNTATQAELERLRGVGVALSERLLAERAKAPFADWQDLRQRVPGLAGRSAQKLSDQGLRVNGQPLPPAR